MWLERRSARQILRPQLKAPLSPHDTHARKSQRLPAALSTGHSSTGRRGGRPEFEHSAKQMGAVRITRRSDVALRSESERPDVAIGVITADRAAHTTVPAQVLKKVGKRPSMPDPFVVLDRQVFSGQLGEVWAPSKVPISLEDGHGRQRGAFSNASSMIRAGCRVDKFIPVSRPPQHPSPRPQRRRPRDIRPRGRPPARARPQAGLPVRRLRSASGGRGRPYRLWETVLLGRTAGWSLVQGHH